MSGQQTRRYEDWVGEEWAGEDAARDPDTTPHWTKDEFVGDQGTGRTHRRIAAADMAEGDRGLSGYRHTGPASHWAPSH